MEKLLASKAVTLLATAFGLGSLLSSCIVGSKQQAEIDSLMTGQATMVTTVARQTDILERLETSNATVEQWIKDHQRLMETRPNITK